MCALSTLISGVYLLAILHFLFFLVLFEQHIAALGLLISFFATLPFPALRKPLSSLPQPTQSVPSPPRVGNAHPYRDSPGEELFSSSPWGREQRQGRELEARTSITARTRRFYALPLSAHALMSPRGTAFNSRGGASRENELSLTPPYSTTGEAEEEAAVVLRTKEVSSVYCPDALEGSSTAARANDEAAVDVAHDHPYEHAGRASVVHAGWVWATAVVSLFSVCLSTALLLFVAKCSSQDLQDTGCTAPSWAYRAPLRILLTLFAGIRVEEGGVSQRHFFVTIASFSTVGALSVGQAVCATLLRCRSRTRAPATFQLEKISKRVGAWLMRSFTFAPLSLLWICAAGIGQGTLFGCIYVLLAVLMLLHYPRCVLSWRRRCWLVYSAVLLLLWTVQACFRLPWLRESLEGYTATRSPARRHLLTVWGGLLGATAANTTASRWQVVGAIGLWWAGVECFCLHTSSYVTLLAASRWAPVYVVAQHRARYKQALAVKEGKQLACALKQRRVAQRKVTELRLQRERRTANVNGGRRGRGCAATANTGMEPPLNNPNGRAGNDILHGDGHAHRRRYAPFGSCGSRGSHRCSTDDSNLTAHSTQVVRGRKGELSAMVVRTRDSCGSARASFVNSTAHSPCEIESQINLHAPLLTPTPPFKEQLRQQSTWNRLNNRTGIYLCDGGSRTEKGGGPLGPSAAAAATVTLAASAVVARYSQESRDKESAPPSASRLRPREHTTSPGHPAGEDGEDGEDGENVDHYSELLNTSPFASPFASPNRQPAAAPPPSALATPPLLSTASTVPILCLRDVSVSSEYFCFREHRRNVVRRSAYDAPRDFSPFHSVANGMIAGGSLPEGDMDKLSLDGPPVVDTTATMPVATVEPPAHAANSHRAKKKAAVATPTAPHAECSEADGEDQEGEPFRTCCLPRAASRAFKGLHKELKTYLCAHTLIVVGKVKPRDANVPQRISGSGDAARTTSATAVADPPDDSSLLYLLMRYAAQHWVWVCALLSLLHYTVSGTAVNLVPSLASLVYAVLPHPWPPRCYVRSGVLFAAASVFCKCLVRATLVSGAVPTLSSTAARCLSALLLSGRVSSSPRSVLSSSSAVTVSFTGWEPWFDITMGVAVLCAAVVQWSLVYSDQCVLGCGAGGSDGRNSIVEEGRLPALLSRSPSPTRNTPHSDATVQSAEAALHPSDHNCTGRLTRWNRRRRGAGADYYSMQLFFDFLSLVLFCWAYYAIAPDDTAPSQDNLFYAVQHNRLPGVFVATTLGLVVVLFAERVIYVLHALVAKCMLHVLLALTYHALYLAWYTMRDASSGLSVTSVSLLMAAKLASLWCGALQLRHGYPLHRAHDPFTMRTDAVHWFGHMVFRVVPFLLELRVLLDWSFSATTLKVQHWMLLEDIHHNVYRRYVDMHDLHWTSRHQGRRFPYYVRVYQGMLSFAAILLVLFFPLFWYSTFGPQVHASRVTAWTSDVAFGSLSALPLYSADAQLSQVPFRTAAATTIGDAAPNPSDLLRIASASDTWQLAQPPQCSSQMWSYTPAALTHLLHELRSEAQQRQNRRAKLVVRNRVTRNRAIEASYTTCSFEESYTLPVPTVLTFLRVLESWQVADSNATSAVLPPFAVPLPSFYTPYVVSSGSSVASMVRAGLAKVDCALTLHRVGQYRGFTCLECASSASEAVAASQSWTPNATQTSSSSRWPTASASNGGPVEAPEHTLVYLIASTDVTTVQSSLSLIPNMGVIALYTSFVLVVSNYIRGFFAGDAHRVVLLQLANPEPVAELLRYIYLARSCASNGDVGDMYLEQMLFLELLDLLRSPERLLALGGRRADDYAREEYREDLYAVTKRPFDLRH
ncbi:hypothetical protein ABB37_03317 [Leptomonas pyrrhocoris]|uniref:Uncharacterized protein n=1 Tax=Leptomonas pyrrhocoris TaxID=157538 RepID=A0A0N0DWT3_LEPPY|nr:hypothetical protein ABB37_03317 [Leptomonas pyrrhocoris]KPA82195.1 hypothetical protein ABB37_03317 [Leptomonas pyrrhocoris]|eukprot:XP_015660634.1 hypothetical protein ABB37_03317 [Leptomonas pyrrhocoris]